MKRDYIIVTNTNKWVLTLEDVTEKELAEEIEFIRDMYPECEFYAYPTDLGECKTF